MRTKLIPHLLPGVDSISLGGSIHGFTELPKVHQAQSKLGVVVDVLEQQAGRLIHTLVETPLTNTL